MAATTKVVMVFRSPNGSAHDIEGDAATLALINTKVTQRDLLVSALREALKLVNGDNTRKSSDVLREQWERLLSTVEEL
jgi:hypothetical protein